MRSSCRGCVKNSALVIRKYFCTSSTSWQRIFTIEFSWAFAVTELEGSDERSLLATFFQSEPSKKMGGISGVGIWFGCSNFVDNDEDVWQCVLAWIPEVGGGCVRVPAWISKVGDGGFSFFCLARVCRKGVWGGHRWSGRRTPRRRLGNVCGEVTGNLRPSWYGGL